MKRALKITKRKRAINGGNKFFYIFSHLEKKVFFFFFKQYILIKIKHNRFVFIESKLDSSRYNLNSRVISY